jgi:ABC-type transporter Mla subunit MlaD
VSTATVPVTRATTAKLGYQGVTGIAHILLEDSGNDPTPLAVVAIRRASKCAPR